MHFYSVKEYMPSRLKKLAIKQGKTNFSTLANLILKKLIYQNRGKRSAYSLIHYEILIEIKKKESEEIYAIQNDKIEIYKKWEKFNNAMLQ